MVHIHLPSVAAECPALFSAPDRSARARLGRQAIAPCRAAYPSRSLADGEEFQNRMKPEETYGDICVDMVRSPFKIGQGVEPVFCKFIHIS